MKEKQLVIVLAVFGVIALCCYLVSVFRRPKQGHPVIEQKETEHKKIRSALDSLGPMIKLDPVRHCQVYKHHGCSHVDGFLCDVKTCNISVDGMIPIKKE